MMFGFAPHALARRRRRGTTPAPTPAPTPALPQAARLVAAWSADDIAPQADNSAIAGWTDGKGRAVAGAFGSVAMPRYRTNAIGTHAAVQFDGTMALTVPRGAVTNAMDSQDYTIIAVVTGIAATTYGVLYASTSSFADGIFMMANGSTVCSYLSSGGSAGFDRMGVPFGDGGFTTVGFTSTIDTMRGAGNGLSRLYINGGCVGCGVGQPERGPGSGAGNAFGIGAAVNGAAGGYDSNRFAGQYLRLYVWDRCLTPAEMVAAEKFIRDAYAQPYPWASVRPTIFAGDSLTQGFRATSQQYAYPSIAAGSLGLGYGQWWNLGIGGISMAKMALNGEAEALATALGKPVAVSLFEYYNQKWIDGSTAAQAAAATQAYVGTLRAALAAGSKILLGTSTDSGSDFAETPVSEASRTSYDNAVSSGGVGWGANQVLAMHSDASIGVNGAKADATYFDGDGVHLTGGSGASGYRTLAGLVASALGTL